MMPVTVEVKLPDGRLLEIQFPNKPTTQDVQRVVEQILAQQPQPTAPAKPQPTQAQQLAGALRGTLQRGWNWLRGKLGLKSPEERVREIAGPALAKHPEAMAEMARIESARRQATALGGMLRDAAIAPGNLAAERRYGSALQRQRAQSGTGTQMEQVGTVTQLGNLLGLPQRGAVAWAKQVASKHGAQGSKYADAEDAFMDAAEWGSLLEDLAPSLPKPVRLAMAVPMDIVLDPLLLVPPAKVAGVLGPIVGKLPGAEKVRRGLAMVQGRVLAFLHPTVAKALEQAGELPTPNNIRRALQFADELAGSNIEQLVQRYPQEALALAPEQLLPAVQQINKFAVAEALSNAFESILDRLQQDLPVRYFNAHDVVAAARDFVDSNWDLIDKLQRTVDREEINTILKQMAERLEEAGFGGQDIADLLGSIQRLAGIALINTLNAGAVEAIRRGLADSQKPSGWQRAMGWWKRAATSFNLPAGAVRNFLGNFVAQYLAGEPLKLSPRPFAELLKEAFESTKLTRAGDIGADVLRRGEPPKQALARVAQALGDKAGEIYSGADKLAAAVLAKISDKPPTHFMISDSFRLPERIEWLSRLGILPFATWPTFIVPRLWKGFMENPARWHRLSMALRATGAQEKDNNLYIAITRKQSVEPRAVLAH
jgi:hypothetical protein